LLKIEDRKDQPSPKEVIPPLPFFGKDQPELPRQFQRSFLFPEMLDQSIPTVRGISQPVLFDDLLVQSPLGKIFPPRFAFSLTDEEIVKIVRGNLIDLKEEIPFGHLLLLARGELPAGKFHCVPPGEFLHRLGK
jgi:hypothetical protein